MKRISFSRHMIAATGIACLLAGCGPSDSDPGPGGLTVDDARALDEAAAKLDAEAQPASPPQTQKKE